MNESHREFRPLGKSLVDPRKTRLEETPRAQQTAARGVETPLNLSPAELSSSRQRAGLSATPTFIIQNRDDLSNTKNGTLIALVHE